MDRHFAQTQDCVIAENLRSQNLQQVMAATTPVDLI